MPDNLNSNLDYEHPIKIADDVFWVGFYDAGSGLRCNPYLIIDGEEAVVIDGGSRPEFPTVMMKILQTGISPSAIKALIYHHYDPDLCGSMSSFEELIDSNDLKIITCKKDCAFIRYYGISSVPVPYEDLNSEFVFRSGRILKFTATPYCHSAGSFITYDSKSGVLFSSDLFGSYSKKWNLFLKLEPECKDCKDFSNCPVKKSYCPMPDLLEFHQIIMPSTKALRHSIQIIKEIPCSIIASQHGRVIPGREDFEIVSDRLMSLEEVGIDAIVH